MSEKIVQLNYETRVDTDKIGVHPCFSHGFCAIVQRWNSVSSTIITPKAGKKQDYLEWSSFHSNA
ncbi:hypothetical protein U6B65_02310 [Oscillospiraceae bacterium MB08-C2-2]|nr:hypothetical protein U6B65_02310 [Oscillospiraceae bacterium MB08-C2-2]